MLAFACICLMIVFMMSGFESSEIRSHAEIVEDIELDRKVDFLPPENYSGYIASLSAGESYYDIGKSLSSLEFYFEENGLQVTYEIMDMGAFDTCGTFYFTDIEIKSDILEGTYIDQTFGRMTIKGTLKGTTFTGKIHCQWKFEPASMNFIAIKNKSS